MIEFLRKYKKIIFFVFAFLLFFFRLYALDCDLPFWGKSWYQPVDEGAYGILAINYYKYGDLNVSIQDINNYIAPHVRTNLIGNLFTYMGLLILGNNYYGFRIGSVMCMFINICIIYFILSELQKKYTVDKTNNIKRNSLCKNVLLIYLIFEFTFLMASRTVETSIYRQLFVNITIFIVIKIKEDSKLKYFLLGFFSIFSIVGIYITNLFLFLATSLFVLVAVFQNKAKFKRIILSYCGGGLLAYCICEIYFIYIWKTTILKNCIATLSNFSNQPDYGASGSLSRILTSALNFISSNFNLYNIAIFFLFVLIIPKFCRYIIKSKNKELFFVLLIYILFFCQTLFSEDFIIRKYIIIAPIPIFLIFSFVCLDLEEVFICKSRKCKLYNNLYVIFGALLSIFILLYRLKFNNDGSTLDFSRFDKYAIFLPSFISVVLITLIFIGLISYRKTINSKRVFFLFLAALICSLSVNIYMASTNIFSSKKTFDDRQIMIDLSNIEKKSDYLVGTYVHSYSLYNDFLPILDNYEEMMDSLKDNSDIYYFDYSTEWNIGFGDYLNNLLLNSDYKLVKIKEYHRSYKVYGVNRNMAIYKLMKR